MPQLRLPFSGRKRNELSAQQRRAEGKKGDKRRRTVRNQRRRIRDRKVVIGGHGTPGPEAAIETGASGIHVGAALLREG